MNTDINELVVEVLLVFPDIVKLPNNPGVEDGANYFNRSQLSHFITNTSRRMLTRYTLNGAPFRPDAFEEDMPEGVLETEDAVLTYSINIYGSGGNSLKLMYTDEHTFNTCLELLIKGLT